ncbi:MAG TPA: diguanylate cyclase [Mycobacteriales bacterium]|nr:diguanylate cyclase [Mycobacteriales bacterium]
MPLRIRLSIAFVAIVLVPLMVTALLVRGANFKSLDRQFDAPVTAARSSADAVVAQLQERSVTAATALATRAVADRDGRLVELGQLLQNNPTRVSALVRQFTKDFPGSADFVLVADARGKVVPDAAAGRMAEFVDGALSFQAIADEVVVELARRRVAGEDERSVTDRYVRSRVRLTGPRANQIGLVIAGFWLDRSMLASVPIAEGVGLTLVSGGRVTATTLPAAADASELVRRAGPKPRSTPDQVGDDLLVQDLLVGHEQRSPTLVVSVSLDDAIASKSNTDRGLLAVIVISLIMAGLFGWLLSRVTTRPLAELVDAALAVASGRLDTKIDARARDEVGTLARAFNTMTEELRTYIQALQDSRDELKRNLTRLGDTLSSTHDLKKMLAVILETAMVTIRAEAGSLMLFSANRDELYLKVGRGLDGRLPDPQRVRVQVGDGVAGAVARSGEAVHGTVGSKTGELRLAAAEPRADSIISVPLKSQNRVIGVLNLYDRVDADHFDDSDVATIRSFANQATVAIDNVLLHQEAQRLSITDGLTGLWNFRYFQMTLEKEIERAARFGRPLALLIMDLDNFKNVNDDYGHQRGDSVLIELATRIKLTIREVDILARYGGEEFVLILPETDLDGAVQAAEKVCHLVSQRRFGAAGEVPIRVTVSVGVAVFPNHGTAGSELVRTADAALYRAKEAGRNGYAVATAGEQNGTTAPAGGDGGAAPTAVPEKAPLWQDLAVPADEITA